VTPRLDSNACHFSRDIALLAHTAESLLTRQITLLTAAGEAAYSLRSPSAGQQECAAKCPGKQKSDGPGGKLPEVVRTQTESADDNTTSESSTAAPNSASTPNIHQTHSGLPTPADPRTG
jgi:hypothetical protein